MSCGPETNRPPNISPARMSSLGINRELQLVSTAMASHMPSPHSAREGEPSQREEKEVGGAIMNEQPMTLTVSFGNKRSLSSSSWAPLSSQGMKALLLEFQLEFQTEVSVYSVQISSVAQSHLTPCDPMDGSTPGLPVHHHHPEFTQTHVH